MFPPSRWHIILEVNLSSKNGGNNARPPEVALLAQVVKALPNKKCETISPSAKDSGSCHACHVYKE